MKQPRIILGAGLSIASLLGCSELDKTRSAAIEHVSHIEMREGVRFNVSGPDVLPLPDVEWKKLHPLLKTLDGYVPIDVMHFTDGSVVVELKSMLRENEGYRASFKKIDGRWVQTEGYKLDILQ